MDREMMRAARRPNGFRRLTPGMFKTDRAAEEFGGLPDGVAWRGQLLGAFKQAAPALGLPRRLVDAVDWLFQFTQSQDWEPDSRPIVWPSSAMQQEALGLSSTQTKALNRQLIEAGLITMRDSPSGKRWGRRDAKGRIIEAYGFDLSPLAARYEEFVRIAQEAKAERAEMGRLRRRATIARKGIAQILETVHEYGFTGEEWTRLAQETQAIVVSLKAVERIEEMAIGVEALERRQRETRNLLENRWKPLLIIAPRRLKPTPRGRYTGPTI